MLSIFESMKPNPGGQLPPDQIVGRDAFIEEIWDYLEGRSVYMNDLRRIGKTQIMVKMDQEPLDGWLTIKSDLGGIHSAAEFATRAYKVSFEALKGSDRAFRRMKGILETWKGTEIAGLIKLPDGRPAPWKDVLERTFADLDEAMQQRGQNHRILLLWDEVPYLLANISKNKEEGPEVAMQVLDLLRSLGQDNDRVRLLLTGSIGLHHVLNDLKGEGYNGSPLNRMEHVSPGPLSPVDAIELATNLLIHSNRTCDDPNRCAKAVAESVGYVPFYIHRLISRMPRDKTWTVQSIEALLTKEIRSDNNDWDLQHYRNRIEAYYGNDEALVVSILDVLAQDEPLGFEAIRKTLTAMHRTNDETLRRLLKLLCMDHYLVRNDLNEYQFYLTLIRRWWQLDRSLLK